jgi:hypothetical protein
VTGTTSGATPQSSSTTTTTTFAAELTTATTTVTAKNNLTTTDVTSTESGIITIGRTATATYYVTVNNPATANTIATATSTMLVVTGTVVQLRTTTYYYTLASSVGSATSIWTVTGSGASGSVVGPTNSSISYHLPSATSSQPLGTPIPNSGSGRAGRRSTGNGGGGDSKNGHGGGTWGGFYCVVMAFATVLFTAVLG